MDWRRTARHKLQGYEWKKGRAHSYVITENAVVRYSAIAITSFLPARGEGDQRSWWGERATTEPLAQVTLHAAAHRAAVRIVARMISWSRTTSD